MVALQGLVFVVDDDAEVRMSLRWLLEAKGLEVRDFDSGRAFLGYSLPDQPACLLLDLRMAEMSGIDLREALTARRIQLPTIMITGHGDVAAAVRAMKTGLVDFLEKPVDDDTLLNAVERALTLSNRNQADGNRQAEWHRRLMSLSKRERQVLECMLQGKMNKSMARGLGIAIKTVESHRARVMKKLGVSSLAELVREVLTVDPRYGSSD